MDRNNKKYKAGYVAIVGEPNVGKSTLMNALLDQKISIVTSKPQTTRQRILGILTRNDSQIIFFDTPGLLKPKYLLHKEMIKHAESALADAEIVLVITQVERRAIIPDEVTTRILPLVKKKPVFLVVNKVDKMSKKSWLPIIDLFAKRAQFTEVIPISALKGDNLINLIQLLVQYLPEHEAFYPEDIVSEYPERFFVSEFIRENIFEMFREEIPYSTAVEIREFKERDKSKSLIRADIIVERDSQKGIIIGKNGEALKEIGKASRIVIEEFLQHEVFLDLHVKVREKWRQNETMIRQLGYHSRT